jgi:hypothetical protein
MINKKTQDNQVIFNINKRSHRKQVKKNRTQFLI